MNIALTIALKKAEVKTMMKRIVKCDRQIEANLHVDHGETPAERKDRLLATVADRMKEISDLEKGGKAA
jgi:hypothetical protein